jgi:hypothetical protein
VGSEKQNQGGRSPGNPGGRAALLEGERMKKIVAVALLFQVVVTPSAFADFAADCKTPDACIEQGDRASKMNSAWANASYLKAIALTLKEINEHGTRQRGD